MTKILIMVPAYNEARNINGVLESLSARKNLWDVLVINDASTDRTFEIAKSFSFAKIIDLPFNLGIGGCIQTGFKYAKENDYDIAVQFDGDGQHKTKEIPKLLDILLNEGFDVAVGSRFYTKHSGFRSTFGRRFGIKILEWLTFLLTGLKIKDCTSGFRAYHKKAIHFLSDNYPVDYPEPEAIILLGKNGFRIKEVHTEMSKRQWGKSSITFFNSPYYMTKVMLGMIMTALRNRILKEGNDGSVM